MAAPFLFAASAELFEVSAATFEAGIALDVAALAGEPTLPNLGLVVVDALTLGAGKLNINSILTGTHPLLVN